MGDGLDFAAVDGDGTVDWKRAYWAGCRFAYLNMTPGNSVWSQAAAARRAGVVVGPYVLLLPSRASNPVLVTQNALIGWQHVPGDLPLVMDVELPHGVAGTGLTRAGVCTWYLTSQDTAKYVAGYEPGAYSSRRVLDTDDTDTLHGGLNALASARVWLWLAAYDGTEAETQAPQAWGRSNYWIKQDRGDVRGAFGIRQVDDDRWHYLHQGDSGPRVAWWQEQLNLWLRRHSMQVAQLAVDGSFGDATATVTRVLQSCHFLAADAVVGPLTFAWSFA